VPLVQGSTSISQSNPQAASEEDEPSAADNESVDTELEEYLMGNVSESSDEIVEMPRRRDGELEEVKVESIACWGKARLAASKVKKARANA
jgi:hypothetical protein